jgi:hypothetical protein
LVALFVLWFLAVDWSVNGGAKLSHLAGGRKLYPCNRKTCNNWL